MCYSQVTISVMNRGERREAWFVFRTPHQTVSDQIDQMMADGGLSGTRFDTKPTGNGDDRQVVSSCQTFIDRSIILSIIELRGALLDKDGVVLS